MPESSVKSILAHLSARDGKGPPRFLRALHDRSRSYLAEVIVRRHGRSAESRIAIERAVREGEDVLISYSTGRGPDADPIRGWHRVPFDLLESGSEQAWRAHIVATQLRYDLLQAQHHAVLLKRRAADDMQLIAQLASRYPELIQLRQPLPDSAPPPFEFPSSPDWY
jgi:hypothetical protein